MRLISILPGSLYTRGKFAYHPRDEKILDLRRKGVDVVVNLTTQGDPDLVGVEGLEYIHCVMSDGREVDVETVFVLARKLAARIQEGKKVLVHCHAGQNRTGLISSATVALAMSLTGSQAVDLVQQRRKGSMGTNPDFERYMREDFENDR